MNHLEYRDLNEFNRILFAALALTSDEAKCSIDTLIALCSSLVLNGAISNHIRTINLCRDIELIKVSKRSVGLTEFGRDFLRLNAEKQYEITEKQKELIIQKVIFGGYGRAFTRALFLNFRPNFTLVTYEIGLVDTILPSKFNSLLNLLKRLEVLSEADGRLIVTPKYVSNIRTLLTKGKALTEEELDKALQAERKLGIQAEEEIRLFESERLISMGCKAEAGLVRRIGPLDTTAGYDVESFNGKTNSLIYDRFIEVKAVSQFDYKFNWSKNEIEKAKTYRGKYYLYLLPVVGENKFNKSKLKIICDPYIKVYKNKREWDCVVKSFVFSLKTAKLNK